MDGRERYDWMSDRRAMIRRMLAVMDASGTRRRHAEGGGGT